MRAYSSARLINSALWMQWPSSVIATTPAWRNDPIGANCSPFCPIEIVPVGKTFATPVSLALCFIHAIVFEPSATGDVFGIAITEVNPPATAAAVPVAIVSLAD